MAHRSPSLTVGGAFLLLQFQIVGDTTTISDTSTKVIYGVFFGSSILGVITLALLRTPPSKVEKLEELDQADIAAAKQSHWEVIGKLAKISKVLRSRYAGLPTPSRKAVIVRHFDLSCRWLGRL